MEIQLRLLVEYIRHCQTFVMVHQVADVCMDTLLRIKVCGAIEFDRYWQRDSRCWRLIWSTPLPTNQDLVVARGRVTLETGSYVRLIHEVLELFDELALQNRDPPFDEFLLYVLVENQEVSLSLSVSRKEVVAYLSRLITQHHRTNT
jgi:hypothetical protein